MRGYHHLLSDNYQQPSTTTTINNNNHQQQQQQQQMQPMKSIIKSVHKRARHIKKQYIPKLKQQHALFTTNKTFHKNLISENAAIFRQIALVCGASFASFILYSALNTRKVNASNDLSPSSALHAEEQQTKHTPQKMKEFTREEVAKHNSKETGIWVAYKDGVYDITEFVDIHPGGEKIMLAAGKAIDPFWKLYAIHDKPDILEMLEQYRIGTLKDADLQKQGNGKPAEEEDDPYENEPKREPILKVNTQKAFNAETPPAILVDQFITPNEIFYVRNHLPVPKTDINNYKLQITGIGVKDVKLTLEDLKSKFIHYSVTCTMQCAGNRRSEMSIAKPVNGIGWTGGAIGTAEWTGVRLRDVLQYAGLDLDKCENDPKIRHVQFEGLDKDKHSNSHYGASIPIEKAIDMHGDVLLAFQMNGEDIPRDHGYPLRVIVPGVVGARHVKWLDKIVVSSEESKSYWQQNDYKGLPPVKNAEQLDPKKYFSIQELPVQSSICQPQEGDKISEHQKSVKVRGYAWSGGGRDIVRVDITPDNGESWYLADLKKPIEQRPGRAWAWTPFEADVDIPETHNDKVRICSKAVDSAFNVQPEHVESVWNPRGFLNNVWSCINLTIQRDDNKRK
jgi:sulfite oxidase